MKLIPEPGDVIVLTNGEKFTCCTREYIYSIYPEQRIKDMQCNTFPDGSSSLPDMYIQNVDYIYGYAEKNSKAIFVSLHPDPRSKNYWKTEGHEIASIIPDMSKANNKKLKEIFLN